MRRIVLSLLLVSCSGGNAELGGDAKKQSKDPADRYAGDDENQPADKPAQVSGAFLTCAYLDVEQADGATSGTTPVGCTVIEKGVKAPEDGRDFVLTLEASDDRVVPMRTKRMPSLSPYHVQADLPVEHKTDATLVMTVSDVDDGSETTHELPTREIERTPPDAGNDKLGGESPGTETGGGDDGGADEDGSGTPGTVAPVRFTSFIDAPAYWRQAGTNWDIAQGVYPRTFCANGAIRPRMDTSMLGNTTNSLANMFSNDNILHEKKTVALGTDGCFRKLKNLDRGLFSGSSEIVEGEGCIFMRIDNELLIIPQSSPSADRVKLLDFYARKNQGC